MCLSLQEVKRPDAQGGQRAWGHRGWPGRAPGRGFAGEESEEERIGTQEKNSESRQRRQREKSFSAQQGPQKGRSLVLLMDVLC